MENDRSSTVTFAATLLQAEGMKATGILVPPEIIDQLGAGKRPRVTVSLNGYEYRTTVGVMAGAHMVPVSAAIRSATGLSAGDAVEVALALDASPRTVDVPTDFAAALAMDAAAATFFATLSNSVQRYHVDHINATKSPETRQRRIDKSVQLFLAGKPR